MTSFDDVWPQLVDFAQNNDRVDTLANNSTNEIWYEKSESRLMVRSIESDNDEAHKLPYENLKQIWERGQRDGELFRENTREYLPNQRGSVTLAIFQRALDLPYETYSVRVIVDEDRATD